MTQGSLLEESAQLAKNARETSRLAALKVAPTSGTKRRAVLVEVIAARSHGITDDALSYQLQMPPNTLRPRRVELVEGGWIQPGDREAESFYGNKAIAWVATQKALLWEAERGDK